MDQGYTGTQKIQFLQNALAGNPELNCVYRQNSAAARAAGIKKLITWDEYVAMLLEVANDIDARRTHRSNPRRKQSVNVMELILDDDDEAHFSTLEANVGSLQDRQWDQDTTLEQLEAYQTERPIPCKDNRPSNGRPRNARPRNDHPQRVFMENVTWAKIDPEDR